MLMWTTRLWSFMIMCSAKPRLLESTLTCTGFQTSKMPRLVVHTLLNGLGIKINAVLKPGGISVGPKERLNRMQISISLY